jgi:hypothetical protein
VNPSVHRAYFRFYAELNDHLPPSERFKPLEKGFYVPGSVRDMIESFGVPHPEVELILVNGRSVDFRYVVQAGDRISVYPMFESLDITPELRVRKEPLREPKFVLDVHLGKLAAYLRMLGFDTLYRSCFSDPELVRVSSQEKRILLTRDRGLLKHASVSHGYWVRSTDSRKQAAEIVQRFDLSRCIQPFTRCMACNGLLQPVAKKEIAAMVPKRIIDLHEEFRQCQACGRVYWEGSHHGRMVRFIQELVA